MTGDPVATARTASDALRTLGHQLNGDRLDATQVYDVLGELALTASRFPYLLARLDAALTNAADDGDLVDIDDVGRRHDPALLLVAIGTHLAAAEQAATPSPTPSTPPTNTPPPSPARAADRSDRSYSQGSNRPRHPCR